MSYPGGLEPQRGNKVNPQLGQKKAKEVESSHADGKLQQIQLQVNDMVKVMKTNVEKIYERDEKLADLDKRAENLQHATIEFETAAVKLKRKYWWQNLKMMIIIGVVIAIAFIILIVAITGTG